MTNTNKLDAGKRSLEDFVNYTGEVKKLTDLKRSEGHPAGDVSAEYDSSRLNYARESAAKYDPNIDPETIEDDEQINKYVDMGKGFASRMAAHSLKENLDSVLNTVDQKKLAKTLESSLSNDDIIPIILRVASKEDKQTILKYKQYADLEKSIKLYNETGKFTSKEHHDTIYAMAQEGARKEAEERLSKLPGLSPRDIKLGGQIAAISVREGNYKEEKIKEYAQKGLNAQLEELKKEVTEDKYISAARNTLKNLVMSKNTEDYAIGSSIIYSSAQDEKDEE